MIRFEDAILLVVIFSSILVGIFFPTFGALFLSFPVYCMMALLFLSFLSIPLPVIWRMLKDSPGRISYLLFLKLILLPTLIFFLFHWLFPSHALAALLLSAASTAVISPFFAELLPANSALVVVMVVSSSLLVPLTLPALVKILAGRTVTIPLVSMAEILCAVVFVPFAAAEILKRAAAGLADKLLDKRYSISLALFAMTNLGVFSKYSRHFRQQPSTIWIAFAVCMALAAIYFAAGILFSWKMPLTEQLSMILSLGMMNNVLVLVFSSQFFSPLEPTVAAMYTIPFFALIVPLRAFQKWRLSAECSNPSST